MLFKKKEYSLTNLVETVMRKKKRYLGAVNASFSDYENILSVEDDSTLMKLRKLKSGNVQIKENEVPYTLFEVIIKEKNFDNAKLGLNGFHPGVMKYSFAIHNNTFDNTRYQELLTIMDNIIFRYNTLPTRFSNILSGIYTKLASVSEHIDTTRDLAFHTFK